MLEFIVVFFISYLIHGLGVTIGYHRLLSHRSFSCPKFVEYFFVMAGYLTHQGSPIWWATIHRAHHRHVDTPLDPHSPKFGMYEAYAGWYLHKTYAAHIDPALQSKDLIKDPLYRFLEQGGDWHKAHILAFSISCVVRLTMFLLFGWQITLANMLGSFLVLHLPQMLNVVCHLPKLGYKNYDDGSDSVNVWWVGLLALGEGWHNNHHTDPGSARSGVHFWEFDLSWHVLRLLRAVGLVTRVNEKSHLQLLQRSKVRIARSLELREKAIALAAPPQLVPVYAVSSVNNK